MAQRLFKRGDTWYGWFFDSEGKRVQRSTKCRDKQAAEAVLREWERRASDPAYAAANTATLERALAQFLTDRSFKGRAKGTLDSYRVKAGHVVRVLGSETKLARVDAREIDRSSRRVWAKARRGTPCTRSSRSSARHSSWRSGGASTRRTSPR
jgi:hypothetical protein